MAISYSEDDAGVIPRAVWDIFSEKKVNSSYDFSITVSLMEMYKEVLFDLLSNKSREDSVLEVKDDSKKGIYIPGLSEIPVETAQALLNILRKGSSCRSTGATALNMQSSRSHTICCIHVSMNHKKDSRQNKCAKLHLVDLAGSERQKKTGAMGNTFQESININRGIFVLGHVINFLCDEKAQSGFIPYRNSNLTKLLKDSLGGNGIILIIACVSPADDDREETLSTLRFADRARKRNYKPSVSQDTIKQILGQGDPMVKNDNATKKMTVMDSRQETVFKRHVEEAESLSKKLTNALALRKIETKKSHQMEKIEPWVFNLMYKIRINSNSNKE